MNMRLILIIIILFVLLGMLPSWPYAEGWGLGYYPSGGLGLLLLVVLVFFLLDRRRT